MIGLSFVIYYLVSFLFCNQLDQEESLFFALIIFLISCDC